MTGTEVGAGIETGAGVEVLTGAGAAPVTGVGAGVGACSRRAGAGFEDGGTRTICHPSGRGG